MPYVPSKKTDGVSTDRELIDKVVEVLSQDLAFQIVNNYDLKTVYTDSFLNIGQMILSNYRDSSNEAIFIDKILNVGKKYDYEGAFLGELNYGITRVIQRVPQILAEQGKCGLVKGKELRYWLYAMTVASLITVANKLSLEDNIGISGVFEDVKDEYKVRVNKSYEIEQILKSGDCYDTPYFNKVVEVVDESGKNVGYTYIELKNDGKNVKLDKMPYKLVVQSNALNKPVPNVYV